MHRLLPLLAALLLALAAGGVVAAQTQGGDTTGPTVPVGGDGDGSTSDGDAAGGGDDPTADLTWEAPDDGPDWYGNVTGDDGDGPMTGLSRTSTDSVDVSQVPGVDDFDRTIRTGTPAGDVTPSAGATPDVGDVEADRVHVIAQFHRDDPATAGGGGGLLGGIASAIGFGGPPDLEAQFDLTPCGSYMAPGGWENAHCYGVPTDDVDAFADHDAVRAVLHRDADWKTYPETREQIRDGDGERLIVETYPDSTSTADDLDGALGVNVTAQAGGDHVFVSSPVSTTSTLDDVLGHEEVAWVEWQRPVHGAVNESREHVGANDLNGRVGSGGLGVTGEGVTVGVIDSGIQGDHPQFDDVSITNSADWVDWGMPPEDEEGHGTHVAGTITGNGTASDGTPMPGVAPDADLVVARGLNSNGVWAFVAARQLPYGRFIRLSNDAPGDLAAISNSWGVDDTARVSPISRYGAWARSADKWAIKNQDTLLVFSNGNACETDPNKKVDEIGCAKHVGAPALGKNVLSVGATFKGGKVSPLNDLNPPEDVVDLNNGRVKPEVLAPGEGIRASVPTDNYTAKRGTSMAAPHVSGVVALLKEKYGGLDANELRALLVATTSPVRNPNGFLEGYGEVNAHDALRDNNYEATQRRFGGEVKEGRQDTYRFSVPRDAHRIDASLAWMDPDRTAGGTTGFIYNRLDLKLVSPSDATHRDAAAANVKKLTVEDPEAGTWKLQVIGANTGRWYNKPPQQYDGVLRVIADEPAVGVAVDGSAMEGFEPAATLDDGTIRLGSGETTNVSVAAVGRGSVVSDVELEVSTAGIRGLRHCDDSQRATVDAGDVSRGQRADGSVCLKAPGWANAGLRNVTVEVTSTNGVNSSGSPRTVDVPVMVTESRPPREVDNLRRTDDDGLWSADATLGFAWDRATDRGRSGIDGYHWDIRTEPPRNLLSTDYEPADVPGNATRFLEGAATTGLNVTLESDRMCFTPDGGDERCSEPVAGAGASHWDGRYWIYVQAEDRSGNLGDWAYAGPVGVDNTAPEEFAVHLGSTDSRYNIDLLDPSPNRYYHDVSGTDYDLYWEEPDDTSGVARYTYTIVDDDGNVIDAGNHSVHDARTAAANDGSVDVDSALRLSLSSGQTTVQLRAIDEAGNIRSTGVKICVDERCTTRAQGERARQNVEDAQAVEQMGLDEPGQILEEGMLEQQITEELSCPGARLCGDGRPRYLDPVADEDLLVIVEGPDGEVQGRYFAKMQDGAVTSVERVTDPASVDQTVDVTTDAATLQEITAADDTMGAIKDAYDAGDIEVSGVGLGSSLKYGAVETGYGAYRAATGAYDAATGLLP